VFLALAPAGSGVAGLKDARGGTSAVSLRRENFKNPSGREVLAWLGRNALGRRCKIGTVVKGGAGATRISGNIKQILWNHEVIVMFDVAVSPVFWPKITQIT